MHEDDLSFRGLIVGLLLGCASWALLIGLIAVAVKVLR